MAKLGYITLNGKRYPCEEWGRAQQGQPLAITWGEGTPDGVGLPIYKDAKANKRAYFARGWDLTTPPFLRLGSQIIKISGVTENIDPALPLYVIEAIDSVNVANVAYLFNGPTVWKINTGTNAVIYNTDRAGVQYGRPVIFDAAARIPRGETVAAVNLAVGAGAGNEADELGVGGNVILANMFATHFGAIQDETSAKIVRAFRPTSGYTNANKIETATTAAGLTASPGPSVGFEVGDDSFDITDILTQQGENLIVRPDQIFRFDPNGNSMPMQDFVKWNLSTSALTGAGSLGYSAYAYWVHNTGLYLVYGDVVRPVGLESDQDFHIAPNSDFDSFPYYLGSFALGRWAYFARRTQVWQTYIQDDGTLLWFGPLFTTSGNPLVLAGGSLGPNVWFGEGSNIYKMQLEPDGSTRGELTDTRSTTQITTPEVIFPQWDAGRPDRLKQLRKFWYLIERIGAGETLQAVVQRDGAANQNWGSAASTSGLFERIGVAGTSDTFRRLKAGFTAAGHGSSTGPIVEKWGLEAHSADMWRVTIPLTAEEDTGSQGIDGSLQNLRQLKHGQAIEVQAPGRNGSFTAHVYQVQEETLKYTADARPEYQVQILIEVFDIETGLN